MLFEVYGLGLRVHLEVLGDNLVVHHLRKLELPGEDPELRGLVRRVARRCADGVGKHLATCVGILVGCVGIPVVLGVGAGVRAGEDAVRGANIPEDVLPDPVEAARGGGHLSWDGVRGQKGRDVIVLGVGRDMREGRPTSSSRGRHCRRQREAWAIQTTASPLASPALRKGGTREDGVSCMCWAPRLRVISPSFKSPRQDAKDDNEGILRPSRLHRKAPVYISSPAPSG